MMLSSSIAALVAAAGGFDATIETLVAKGDSLAGLGDVTWIGHFDVGRGADWTAQVGLDAPLTLEALVVNGAPIAAYNQATNVPGISYTHAFPPQMNDAGSVAWPSLVEPFFTYESALFVDGELMLLDGDPGLAPELPPGLSFRFFQAARIGRAETVVACDLTGPTAGLFHQCLLRVANDAATAQAVVVQTGDLLPGAPGPVVSVADALEEYDLNRLGSVAYVVGTEGGLAWVFVDDTLVLGSGDALAPLGLAFQQARGVALNDQGNWAVVAALAGGAGSVGALVVDGSVLVHEGDPGPGGFVLTSIAWSIDLTSHGRALWRGAWADPDSTRDEGIFLDERLLIQEGVTLINGRVLTALGRATISDDGRVLLFSGGIGPNASAADALFRVVLPPG